MKFFKMHGLGNDFVLVDAAEENLPDPLPEMARRICHRRFGIGSDGLILVYPSGEADGRMRMFNPDGSEAEMCGNGIRCVARFLHEQNRTLGREEVHVETAAGLKRLRIVERGERRTLVQVEMGMPRFGGREIPLREVEGEWIDQEISVGEETYRATAVSMGNPHCVIFVDHVDLFPVEKAGSLIERHSLFPERTNVEFVEVFPSGLKQRTWERGVGETLACGTGASAVLAAAFRTGRSGRNARIALRGGELEVSWPSNGPVFLVGPAEDVFQGEWLD